MSERISIYDNQGNILGVLKASVSRSWVLNGFGEANFDMAYSDPKCLLELIEYGNLIYVEHSSLANWLGVIDIPRQWRKNSVTIKAFDIGKIWYWRRPTTTLYYLGGTYGALITELINEANVVSDTRIYPGAIDAGLSFREKISDTVGKHIENIRTYAGYDMSFDYVVDSNRRIAAKANFTDSVGSVAKVALTEGVNIETNDNVLSEEGTIINDLLGYGDATSSGMRTTGGANNKESISRYGLRQAVATFTGVVDPITLANNSEKVVNANKNPRRILKLRALDIGDTFKWLRLGNTFQINLFSIGFTGAERGLSTSARLTGFKYVSNSQYVDLVLEESING